MLSDTRMHQDAFFNHAMIWPSRVLLAAVLVGTVTGCRTVDDSTGAPSVDMSGAELSTSFDVRGRQYRLSVSASRLRLAPRWEEQHREPPLPVGRAIALARKRLSAAFYDARDWELGAVGLGRALKLRGVQHNLAGQWKYEISFRPPEWDAPNHRFERSAYRIWVLMDGGVIAPEERVEPPQASTVTGFHAVDNSTGARPTVTGFHAVDNSTGALPVGLLGAETTTVFEVRGRHYGLSVSDSRLQLTPRWEEQHREPPLPVGRAIALARGGLSAAFSDARDWELDSVHLSRAFDYPGRQHDLGDQWIYYIYFRPPEWHDAPKHEISGYLYYSWVLMDGAFIEPEEGVEPPYPHHRTTRGEFE